MEARFFLLRVAVVLVVILVHPAAPRLICHDDSYVMNGDFCYRYVRTEADYSAANRTCVRDGRGATLLFINSVEENDYVWTSLFVGEGSHEFWLGLDDQVKEGTFKWLNSSSIPSYTNYSVGFEATNSPQYNCVIFTAAGWAIEQDFCGNARHSYVCKAAVCDSSDGVMCDSVSGGGEGGGLAAGAIAAIVIILLLVIILIVVVVVLLVLWKFYNDLFRRYLCCCAGAGSKKAMMSLQQENQRLRQELNQKKISSSGRYPMGAFGKEVMSGIPDGQGGTLPALKQAGGQALSSSLSPLRSSSTQPPPLSIQRMSSQISPMPLTTPTSHRPPFTSTPTIFTPHTPTNNPGWPGRQPGRVVSRKSTGPSLPTLQEREDKTESRDKIIHTGGVGGLEDKVPPLTSEEVKPAAKEEEGEEEGGEREGVKGEGGGGGGGGGDDVKLEEVDSDTDS